MRQLPKPYLLLSSVLTCLIFVSCTISKYQSSVKPFIETLTYQKLLPVVDPKGTSSKFKANIDVLNRHFTGIVIVKKTDSVTTHVIFVTELGMKMFDLEQKDTSLNMVYVFEPMNKPNFIKVLKTNFNNMLLLGVFDKDRTTGFLRNKQKTYELLNGKEKRYLIVDNTNNLITQATFSKKKKTSKITYVYNAEAAAYTQIKCVQYGLVKIKIELNKISE
jgi:hypothetical protein